ncbi:MAG: hypothetical protein V3U52_06375 [Thermoplasmata archaeon]
MKLESAKLMVFLKNQSFSLIDSLGWKDEEGKLVRKDGEAVVCRHCEDPIDADTLGAVMPGSLEVYCDNPVCFAEYVSREMEY